MIKESERDGIFKITLKGIVFLSGDVHRAEFLVTPTLQYNATYNFYEFTSSGMTHTSSDWVIFLI